MRLGLDVIVLSKSEDVMCVGMLSQSYLKQIGAEQITVPIISIKEAEAKKYILLTFSNGSLLSSWSLPLCGLDHCYQITLDMLK